MLLMKESKYAFHFGVLCISKLILYLVDVTSVIVVLLTFSYDIVVWVIEI